MPGRCRAELATLHKCKRPHQKRNKSKNQITTASFATTQKVVAFRRRYSASYRTYSRTCTYILTIVYVAYSAATLLNRKRVSKTLGNEIGRQSLTVPPIRKKRPMKGHEITESRPMGRQRLSKGQVMANWTVGRRFQTLANA